MLAKLCLIVITILWLSSCSDESHKKQVVNKKSTVSSSDYLLKKTDANTKQEYKYGISAAEKEQMSSQEYEQRVLDSEEYKENKRKLEKIRSLHKEYDSIRDEFDRINRMQESKNR